MPSALGLIDIFAPRTRILGQFLLRTKVRLSQKIWYCVKTFIMCSKIFHDNDKLLHISHGIALQEKLFVRWCKIAPQEKHLFSLQVHIEDHSSLPITSLFQENTNMVIILACVNIKCWKTSSWTFCSFLLALTPAPSSSSASLAQVLRSLPWTNSNFENRNNYRVVWQWNLFEGSTLWAATRSRSAKTNSFISR